MSDSAAVTNVGQAITAVDTQRAFDIGARGGDDLAEMLNTLYSTRKGIMPLAQESATVYPRNLVYQSTTAGNVMIRAAGYFAFDGDHSVFLIGKLTSTTDYGPFSSTGGADRYDLVYATLRRTVSLSATRKVKDATSGDVTSQTIDLLTDPAVSFGLVPNVLSTDPLASLPADSPTAYNLPVCMVKLTNPYVSGDAIPQSKIYQLWSGVWTLNQRVQQTIWGTGTAGGNTISSDNKWSKQRFGEAFRLRKAIKYAVNPTTGIILDNSRDYRYRDIWVRGILPKADAGAYKVPDLVVAGGAASAWGPNGCFTGSDGQSINPCLTVVDATSGQTFVFYAATATGYLTVDISGALVGGVDNNWLFSVEVGEQYDLGAAPPY